MLMALPLLYLLWCISRLPVTAAHSWLACADWDELSKTCHGYARNWHKRPSIPFGTDVGRDIRPGADVPQGLFCDPNKEGGSDPVEGRYSDIYPMARVGRGQQLVWQWPAKNHADVGTQRMVQLFISKGPGLGDDFSHITSKADWVQRYPKLQQTFSNCFVDGNRVGSGVDKAVCSGTFTVPNHLPLGIYTFMWWWEFNGGEFYNSCADVLITNVTRPTGVPPTTGAPTTGPPTNCNGAWAQCGGNGWGGATCCVSGYTCNVLNPYYSQCVPGTSPTPAPTTMPPPPATMTMTTSTLTPKLSECESFCAQSQDSWSFKCSWKCCTGCSECAATTTTTTTYIASTTAATAATTTATTTATAIAPTSTTPPPQVCKSWCAGNAKSWVKKCTWEKCRGCAECVPLGRRLSGYAEHPTHAILV